MDEIFKNKKEIELYKEKYYVENILFKEIGPKAKKRGYLTKKEFLAICLWKTSRPKKRYLENKELQIIKITTSAFSENNEESKIKKLCELRGVAIPVASAILTVVDPKVYGIIDIRCMQELGMKHSYPSIKDWIEYIGILRQLKKQFNLGAVRDIEMALFVKHRFEQKGNLYG